MELEGENMRGRGKQSKATMGLRGKRERDGQNSTSAVVKDKKWGS